MVVMLDDKMTIVNVNMIQIREADICDSKITNADILSEENVAEMIRLKRERETAMKEFNNGKISRSEYYKRMDELGMGVPSTSSFCRKEWQVIGDREFVVGRFDTLEEAQEFLKRICLGVGGFIQ